MRIAMLVMPAVLTTAVAVEAQPGRVDFRGPTPPADWALTGNGRWERGTGLLVEGTGDDVSYWSVPASGVQPGTLWRLRFTARSLPGSSAMTVISGLEGCNRDHAVSARWSEQSFVFRAPDNTAPPVLRLGQWHLKGRVAFRDISLRPVLAVHSLQGGLLLGAGESVDGRGYEFSAQLSGEGSNSARPLARHTAAFNSNRWVLGPGAEVVYRFAVPGASHASATIRLSVSHRAGGRCLVEAARDGSSWSVLGALDSLGVREFAVPPDLLPTASLWVRLRGEETPETHVQVDGVGVRCTLDRNLPRAEGATRHLEVVAAEAGWRLEALGIQPLPQGGEAIRLRVHGPPGSGRVRAEIRCLESGRAVAAASAHLLSRGGEAVLPITWNAAGTLRVEIAVRGAKGARALVSAVMDLQVPARLAADYGLLLRAAPDGEIWWCEAARNVGPERPAPRDKAAAIRLTAAGRERAACQLVLRPRTAGGPVRVAATPLRGPRGARIPASAVGIRRVEYVTVRVPTDRIGAPGEWPDPLPPLEPGWTPRPGRNNPLWISLTVPHGTPPGEYRGELLLMGRSTVRVPVTLRVWGFSLPARTALRSGFGVSPGNISRYHRLRSDASRRRVWDLYMRDFAAHRLNPYDPMALDPIQVRLEGSARRVVLDFTRFDAAAERYLDVLGFNSFVIGIQGLGGGRHPRYDHGAFLGHAADTPEYDRLMRDYGRQLQDHLEQRGWLEKAYVYWYDEPEAADYPFVRQGMERLRRYFPKLRRMLTEEFQPALFGSVDLWCPITYNYAAGPARDRQRMGEEVWWYVCTGPKEPYCGLFIDHPAIELRLWLWQTWMHRVDGILIWETTWWTSPTQFPSDRPQDPWADPMAYTSEASGVWGNGDGRFFYPPRRPGTDEILEPPVDSLRWEMLGQGVQDWDCFHLLEQLVSRAERRGDASALVQRSRRLLTVPDSICRDMTHFTIDPRLLDRHRAEVSRAIEALAGREAAAARPRRGR